MIQRIQSVFLLLVCVLMTITIFSPLLLITNSEYVLNLNCFGVLSLKNPDIAYFTWGIVSIAGLGALVAFINIFLFKKRKLQMKIGTVTSLLIILFYITVYVYFSSFASKYEYTYLNIQYGIILPIIALIFNILAILNIKKDEKLVRSLDRIR